ncbi:MAG: hypothetical protein ACK4HB_02570 [Candidatus Bipolaricaulia bacterium]
MNSFESVRAQLERRQRMLHGLAAMGWIVFVTLGVTALLLILGSLRLLPTIALIHWVSANILIGALAFAVGWLRPLNRTEMLFRADRNLHSHEQLVTLYELSVGDGPKEFLPLLAKRLERLALDVREALPMAQADRWRWTGVLALALFCLGMASFVQPGIFVWTGSEESIDSLSSPLRERDRADWLQTPPVDLAQKLASLRERLERARAAFALNPNDPRARAALQHLQAEISQEQERVLPLPRGEDNLPSQSEKSNQDASLTENPEGDVRPRRDSSDQSSQLDQLLQGLRSIQEQAQKLSPEELQKLLDQLRESNFGPVLQSVQSSQELSEKLEELIKNLEERQRFSEELENLQREVQSALSQSEAQTARSDEKASEIGQPHDASQSSQSAQSARESAESRERSERDESKSYAGYGHAPLDPEAVQDLPDLSEVRERTQPLSVPGPHDEDLQILFEIISMGLPQSADAPPHSAPVQIDYEKVETLIDALEIPVELRESVRRYFLSLSRR